MKRLLHLAALCFSLLLGASPALAQKRDPSSSFTRANPQFLKAFREVVADVKESTIRVLCDDKDAALGMVVSTDGLILTKACDLKGEISCKIGDRTLEAKIIGVHKQHDLALLKVDADDLTPVKFQPSKSLGVGSWIAFAGPGEDPVALGVVSVATRTINVKAPVISLDPNKSGYLGVLLESATDGLRVAQVMPKTPAEKSGLKMDDVILSMEGKFFAEPEDFSAGIQKFKPGDEVKLRVRRGEDELDLKATLGKRPASANRSDVQNKMGSELSSRRSGYPTFLQHDSVVRPVDCGGPLVDLEGRVIGVNICRAGRTESYAIPSETVLSVLADLKSGKLAPK